MLNQLHPLLVLLQSPCPPDPTTSTDQMTLLHSDNQTRRRDNFIMTQVIAAFVDGMKVRARTHCQDWTEAQISQCMIPKLSLFKRNQAAHDSHMQQSLCDTGVQIKQPCKDYVDQHGTSSAALKQLGLVCRNMMVHADNASATAMQRTISSSLGLLEEIVS